MLKNILTLILYLLLGSLLFGAAIFGVSMLVGKTGLLIVLMVSAVAIIIRGYVKKKKK